MFSSSKGFESVPLCTAGAASVLWHWALFRQGDSGMPFLRVRNMLMSFFSWCHLLGWCFFQHFSNIFLSFFQHFSTFWGLFSGRFTQWRLEKVRCSGGFVFFWKFHPGRWCWMWDATQVPNTKIPPKREVGKIIDSKVPKKKGDMLCNGEAMCMILPGCICLINLLHFCMGILHLGDDLYHVTYIQISNVASVFQWRLHHLPGGCIGCTTCGGCRCGSYVDLQSLEVPWLGCIEILPNHWKGCKNTLEDERLEPPNHPFSEMIFQTSMIMFHVKSSGVCRLNKNLL